MDTKNEQPKFTKYLRDSYKNMKYDEKSYIQMREKAKNRIFRNLNKEISNHFRIRILYRLGLALSIFLILLFGIVITNPVNEITPNMDENNIISQNNDIEDSFNESNNEPQTDIENTNQQIDQPENENLAINNQDTNNGDTQEEIPNQDFEELEDLLAELNESFDSFESTIAAIEPADNFFSELEL